jgi:hypothetical protein
MQKYAQSKNTPDAMTTNNIPPFMRELDAEPVRVLVGPAWPLLPVGRALGVVVAGNSAVVVLRPELP